MRGLALVREPATLPPVAEVATSAAVLRRVAGGNRADTLRVVRTEPTVAFGRLDRLRPGFPAAAAAARGRGFTPVLRDPGGHAAAYHQGALVIEETVAGPGALSDMHARFRARAGLYAEALRGLGVDARVGEVPGAYCPGEHSVNARGVVKLVGTAQRIVRNGFLFSAVVVVADGSAIRAVLTDVYAALGLDWDPASAGAAEDERPGLSLDAVERAVVAAYAQRAPLQAGALDADTRALAATLEARHQVEADGW